jgi:hypothetical protein
LKRQQKRKEKERRKGLVDNSLGAHSTNLQPNPGIDLATLAQQLVPQQQPLQMTETNYLTLLCNNLGIPAVARSLITGNIPTTTTGTSNPEISAPVDPSTSAAAAVTTNTTQEGESGDQDSKDKVQQFPFQLLELLQQLQQYQPQNQGTSENAGTSDSAEFQLPNSGNASFNAATSSALTDGDDTRPEEKLAALLTSTLQAASAAAATSLTETKEGEIKDEATQEGEGSGNQQQQQQQQQQNAEFPMDAVLTLMQLNAGWRQ